MIKLGLYWRYLLFQHTIRPNASRRNPDRSNRDRPRPHRSRQLVEEVDRLVTDYELANLAAILDFDEELENLANDDDDLGNLLAMSFLLMQMDEEGTSDEDI